VHEQAVALLAVLRNVRVNRNRVAQWLRRSPSSSANSSAKPAHGARRTAGAAQQKTHAKHLRGFFVTPLLRRA
jgi:hypothetical protein